MTYLISLIINTLDRASVLKDALAAVAALRGVTFELIIVEGPSQDHTAAILEPWKGRIKRLSCPDANLAHSRNIGLSAAAGELVAFLDDDAAPHPYWLKRLVGQFDDQSLGAAGGYTIGRNGVTFQTRKIVVDRLGKATMMADWFDERGLSRPNSALIPAPMGTNVMFRRDALAACGGFDETYSYYLEETDLCLRLVDTGWKICFVPDAFVWHGFAQSSLRTERDIPRGLRALALSKAYFIGRWNASNATGRDAFLEDKRSLLVRLYSDGALHADERLALTAEVEDGFAEGTRLALARAASTKCLCGDWDGVSATAAFLPMRAQDGLRIALICRHFPPGIETGIGRWSAMLAEALVRRGHIVHVVCEGRNGSSITFKDGIWKHELSVPSDFLPMVRDLELPPAAAAFSQVVRRQIEAIKSFGLDVVSFPIWDVEGAALLGDPELPVVMSLHTTFGLSLPWRPEWREDPIFREEVVEPMRKAEARGLRLADLLLANSRAVIDDIAQDSGIQIADRAFVAPHGVEIPKDVDKPRRAGPGLQCLFVGRYELRKGPDIALGAVSQARMAGADVRLVMAGCTAEGLQKVLPATHMALFNKLLAESAVEIVGIVPRAELDALLCSADIALVVSRYESFGLVAAEAMAKGTPVIACSVGGLTEIIDHGTTGYLVDLKDAEHEIAGHLARLATEASLLTEMSQAASEVARRRFSTDEMARAVEEALREAIRRHALRQQRHAGDVND